jgi:predicted 3-demethylubiquinone-9 3-methyltransferase (glyoxalase superfamily)
MSVFASFPRITPFLWFDTDAEDAVNFDISVFKNSRRLDEVRNTGEGPGKKGDIITIAFELGGWLKDKFGLCWQIAGLIAQTLLCVTRQPQRI